MLTPRPYQQRILRNDLTDRHFGILKVLRRSDDTGGGKKPVVKWVCQCECGNVVSVKSDSLLSGHTSSCGCGIVKHGFAHKERLYGIWQNMKRRCYDPTNKRYSQYGGKGVTVCEEWCNGYLSFRSWSLENGYADHLTIDRKDNDGNYEPGNCRWATPLEQANNMSSNRIIEYNGALHTMSEWSDILGISYGTINHRVQRNWSMERIVNTPERRTSHGT